MKLEELQAGAIVTGITLEGPALVVAVSHIGDEAISVVYKAADGVPAERMLFRADEAKLAAATVGRPWGFDADGTQF